MRRDDDEIAIGEGAASDPLASDLDAVRRSEVDDVPGCAHALDDGVLARDVRVIEAEIRLGLRAAEEKAILVHVVEPALVREDEPLRLELQHFLQLVEDGPGDFREADDGLAVVRALDRLTTSLRTGEPA